VPQIILLGTVKCVPHRWRRTSHIQISQISHPPPPLLLIPIPFFPHPAPPLPPPLPPPSPPSSSFSHPPPIFPITSSCFSSLLLPFSAPLTSSSPSFPLSPPPSPSPSLLFLFLIMLVLVCSYCSCCCFKK